MYKFRIFRRPLLSSVVVTAALLSLTSLASAQGAASPAATATTAAPAPAAKTATTAAPAPKADAQASKTEAQPKAQPADKEAAPSEAAPAAPTDEEREAARLSFEAGTKAYGEADYATAVSEFKKAYEAIPSPHAEYWIAVSLDKGDAAGENKAATVAAYETFLSNPGAAHVGADQVSESQARVSELKKSLPAKVTIVSAPAGAAVTVNGQAQEGVTPLTLELAAGTYKVGLSLEGHDATEMDVVAEGGTALEQQVTLAATPVPVAAAPVAAPAAATEPTKKNIVPAAVTLGLGGVGLITGTIFGIMALNSKSDFNDNPTVDNADAAERNALIADMSFGVALTLGITGIVLLTAGDDDAPAETASNSKKKNDFMVAPYASRTGGGASARLTF